MKGHDIIVIGTSAGGIEVLKKLLAPLKSTLPASIFVVLHVSIQSSVKVLANILQRSTELRCVVPVDGEVFQYGHVYLAPPDYQMHIREDSIRLIRGPRENGFRPSVDSLFRSAAAFYGPSTIGIVLTGMLHDGTVGMEAIKRSGGILMVQDPDEAQFPEMPQSVLNNMEIDYCLPVTELSILLQDLVFRPANSNASIPEDIKTEAELAEKFRISAETVNHLGKRSVMNCPDCGGVLWEMDHGATLRYRCHVGHTYVADTLLKQKDSSLEEALWVALRILEERKNMLISISGHHTENEKSDAVQRSYQDKISEAKSHISLIRGLLMQDTNVSDSNTAQSETDSDTQHGSGAAAG